MTGFQFTYAAPLRFSDLDLLAEGDGVQVYMDLAANRSESLPAAYRKRIIAHEGAALVLK